MLNPLIFFRQVKYQSFVFLAIPSLLIFGLLLPMFVFAQTACGNIVEFVDGDRVETPIENCSNPFGVSHGNPIVTHFGGTPLEDGAVYSFLNEERFVFFSNINSSYELFGVRLYFHEGEDYIKTDFDFGNSTFTTPGTYTLVVEASILILIQNEPNSWLAKLGSFLVHTVHAEHNGHQITISTFEVLENAPEPEIDPLILQYEPVLYLHPDEEYKPMNVEVFIGASALWDDRDLFPDTLLQERGTVTVDDLNDPDSNDWYLAFSSDEAKTFDTSVAKARYDQLVADGDAQLTYYAHKVDDGDYTVLQYWYFYAFNNWLEHGGFNNHEGDWESVFVFLDKQTQEPKYVAYSAHHNDGIAEQTNPFQYDSVRRDWDSHEVTKEDGQIVSFVALGSHANYPNNGDEGAHIVPSLVEDRRDKTSTQGEHLVDSFWGHREPISTFADLSKWLRYEGLWGSDSLELGFDGPQGPNFLAPLAGGGVIRFQNPVEWAGIANDENKTVFAPTNILTFPNSGTVINFAEALHPGTNISVDLHDENISFGINHNEVQLLPHFWDLESNIEDNSFEAVVSFQYDLDELNFFGVDENNIVAFFYNEVSSLWEKIPTIVDTVARTVSFDATHFSRYALGVEELRTIDEIYADLLASVGALTLEESRKNRLLAQIEYARDANTEDPHTLRRVLRILTVGVARRIEYYEDTGQITESVDAILGDLEKIIEQIGE